MYVTVFEGSKEEKISFDQESFDAWRNYVSKERIINGNKKDNFWEMGDTGPCGPCSEIHVDIRDDKEREKIDGKSLINSGNPQVIEIWNLVFMEFNRKSDGSLEKLPAQHVDTGMGFERLCMVLQGKKSSYDSDVFQPIIQKIEKICGMQYSHLTSDGVRYSSEPSDPNPSPQERGEGSTQTTVSEQTNIAMRVIADHIRAISFAIADGQLPSNTGAGYVIRRILRRAVRYGYQSLGVKEPFLHSLVSVLAGQMGEFFPEIEKQKFFVEKVIKEEEISFLHTLEQGLKKIEAVCIGIKNSNTEKIIGGEIVFELYDTYGFPVDLTSLIARQYGLSINEIGFETELGKQKSRSRQEAKVQADDWLLLPNSSPQAVPAGRQGEWHESFVGYNFLETASRILKYRKIKAKGKEQYQIILDKTPFYAESGGQVGDTGMLESGNEKIRITDTKKENNLTIHFSESLPKDLSAEFKASVDKQKRLLIMNNHTATHLLHAALRKILGNHVEQRGSLVNEEYLRFDFSHFSKITDEEISKIEVLVNEKIRENIPVQIDVVSLDQAKKAGAMALFGEKYGEQVRMVTADKNYSIELCGGTHVAATGQIGYFKLVAESAVAAGIRRIEALTAVKAEEFINTQLATLSKVKELLKQPKEIIKSLETVLYELSEAKHTIIKDLDQRARVERDNMKKNIEKINGINVVAKKIDIHSAEHIRNISFEMHKDIGNLFLVIGAEVNGKAFLSVMISQNLVKEKNLDARKIVNDLAKEINGGGGGQPNYATAGGPNIGGIKNAVEMAKKYIS